MERVTSDSKWGWGGGRVTENNFLSGGGEGGEIPHGVSPLMAKIGNCNRSC